jgi:hypothetical protein
MAENSKKNPNVYFYVNKRPNRIGESIFWLSLELFKCVSTAYKHLSENEVIVRTLDNLKWKNSKQTYGAFPFQNFLWARNHE